jgi:hypothetical protein
MQGYTQEAMAEIKPDTERFLKQKQRQTPK